MGGRAQFLQSGSKGINPELREYEQIARIGHIKVLKWNNGDNNRTITYSNTPNTTYYSATKQGRIEKIYYYRDHRLIKSVDFRDGETPHVHYWPKSGETVGRKRHDSKNFFPLDERDRRLYNAAVRYNREHGFA